MSEVIQEVDKLLNLAHLQKSLAFLAENLKNPEYNLELFRNDIVGYLKEAQYNNRIPKDIDIENSIYFKLDNSDGTVYVNFSQELEDYITDNGNYVIDEIMDSSSIEGVERIHE